MMKILKFNEQMIAAIRDGRKTQTRRVMYPQPPDGMKFFHLTAGDAHFLCDDGCTTSGFLNVRFPYLGFIDSNLKIEITGYRCERLGDISESDCIKEGMTVDEVTLKIEMYGSELTVSGSSPEHLAHVVKSLNLVLGGLK